MKKTLTVMVVVVAVLALLFAVSCKKKSSTSPSATNTAVTVVVPTATATTVVISNFTFDTTVQGWSSPGGQYSGDYAIGGATGGGVVWSNAIVDTAQGSIGSLAVTGCYAASTDSAETKGDVEVTFSTPITMLSTESLSAWIYVPANVAALGTAYQAAIFLSNGAPKCGNGPAYDYSQGAWTPLSTAGWIEIGPITAGALCSGNGTCSISCPIATMGIQIMRNDNPIVVGNDLCPVTFYLDDITY